MEPKLEPIPEKPVNGNSQEAAVLQSKSQSEAGREKTLSVENGSVESHSDKENDESQKKVLFLDCYSRKESTVLGLFAEKWNSGQRKTLAPETHD